MLVNRKLIKQFEHLLSKASPAYIDSALLDEKEPDGKASYSVWVQTSDSDLVGKIETIPFKNNSC